MEDLSQFVVDDYGKTLTQPTHIRTVLGNLGIDPKSMPKLRVYMQRSKYFAKMDGRPDGWYRPIDDSLEEVDWWTANGEKGLNFRLPMAMHEYCEIYPKSLIVVAGRYNEGKTAFLVNIVNLNMDEFETYFFISEGKELIAKRFKKLNTYMPTPPPFKTYFRTKSFQDIIRPNALNVIDYLRVDPENFTAVWADLEQIYAKLDKGIAVVAMQKPPGDRKLAYGGPGTAFEPQLYIAIDKGKAGFEKIKVPKMPEESSNVDPYRLIFEFKIKNGVNFTDLHLSTG